MVNPSFQPNAANQNLTIPWIKSKTPRSIEIVELLEGFLEKKHKWNLDGSSAEYDFITGCYGNPDSKYMFVAEIPSFSGCQVVKELYPPEMRWKGAWRTSTGDLIYRICLHDHKRIPDDPLSDEPWTWNCWLTDLVKCPHTDSEWKMMKNSAKEDLLLESAKIFQNELEIISPETLIVVGRTRTKSLFKKFMRTWRDEDGEPKWLDTSGKPRWTWINEKGEPKWCINHYARAKSPDPESDSTGFVKSFNEIMKQINRS